MPEGRRPESITAPRTGTVGYSYDPAGRRTQVRYPTAEQAGYSYDGAGRLAKVTDWAGKETGYSYDPAGRLARVQLPNGVESQYGYDAAKRLVSIQHSNWQDWVTSFKYTLDAEGNRTAVSESVAAFTSYYLPALGRPGLPGGTMAMAAAAVEPMEQGISYTYDANDRLTGATYEGAGGDRYAYGYDAVGNRTTLGTTLAGASKSTSYAYDDGDRITSVNSVPYTYDNRGNLTSDGTWTYTYDGANHMVRAEKPGSVHTYRYNGDGLLVAQTIDGAETLFTWDLALEVPQVLATSDGTKDLYGLDRIGVVQGGAWKYSLPDALGSVRQWTDPAGAVLSAQSYGPFGEVREPVGTPPWGYTGEWQDPTCCGTEGMVYLRARWYNPTLGRFQQVDPEPGYLEVPSAQHPYGYAANNPLRYRDPSGELDPLDILFLGLDAVSLANDVSAISRQGWTTANRLNFIIDVGATVVDVALIAVPGIGGGGHLGGGALRLALAGAGGSIEVVEAGRATVRAGQYGLHAWQGGRAVTVGVQAGVTLLAASPKSLRTLQDAQREVESWNLDEDLQGCDETHLDARERERRGEVVARKPDGTPFDHIQDVGDHVKHLKKVANRIESILEANAYRSDRWADDAIAYFRQVLENVKDALNAARR